MRVSGGKVVIHAVTVTVAVTGCAVGAGGKGPFIEGFNVGLAERCAPKLLDAKSKVVFVSPEMLPVAPGLALYGRPQGIGIEGAPCVGCL